MSILIADSGSTKTEWLIVVESQKNNIQNFESFLTAGMNPCLMSDEEIREILRNEVRPQLKEKRFDELRFYGAGCTPAQTGRMQHLLQECLQVRSVDVYSDLYGAAHAFCAKGMGIVAILGTGSGSGLYDGKVFVQHTPSLGYILGDEGSGAVLGRNFLSDLYKGQFPKATTKRALELIGAELPDIIEAVYRQPRPNRYLAAFTRQIKMLENEAGIHEFLVKNFSDFFCRNIVPYGHPELPVYFVGSIAHHFAAPLREAAELQGCRVGEIVQSPVQRIGMACLKAQISGKS